MALEIEGKNLQKLENESGGHRFQRVPPTERRGRVHTSTVTVAVIDPGQRIAGAWDLRGENHYRIEWFSGSGAGGQHRNKHQNSCRLIHEPTGLIEARQGRDRVSNQGAARRALDERLEAMATGATANAISQGRKAMVGTGMRGDKVRTIRVQADEAIDHKTGKRIRADEYLRGQMDRLW